MEPRLFQSKLGKLGAKKSRWKELTFVYNTTAIYPMLCLERNERPKLPVIVMRGTEKYTNARQKLDLLVNRKQADLTRAEEAMSRCVCKNGLAI